MAEDREPDSDAGDASDEALGAAIEEYETALAAGRAPPIEVFCARHPSLGDRLKKVVSISIQLSRMEQPAAPAPSIPERLGHYRVLRELGHGAMARVLSARDERLGRDVALKVLAPDPVSGGARRERFLREARALARLDHSNVVPIHDVGEDGPFCYLAMELMESSLADKMVPSGRDPAEVLRVRQVAAWIKDAAEALAFAHARGIQHRDLKPANLLLGREGRVRVGDLDWRASRVTRRSPWRAR